MQKINLQFDELKGEIEKRAQKSPKVDYWFQELGLEMKDFFGRNLFWVFWKPWGTELRVRRAFEIAKKTNDRELSHFLQNAMRG